MSSKSIAFFGATGGCALAALVRCINAGHRCTALARNPEKLHNMLVERGIEEGKVRQQVTVVEGSIMDTETVAKTLKGSEIVIFSVGGVPKFLPNPLRPTLDQPTICESGMYNVLYCLHPDRNPDPGYRPPLLLAVSTTGTSTETRDVPIAMLPLYHWLLPVPHADKRKMEMLIESAPEGSLSDWIIVMPALLTDGDELGEEKVRAGFEGKRKEEAGGRWGAMEGVVVGYTISREDVGAWIAKEVVERDEKAWRRKKVRLAY